MSNFDSQTRTVFLISANGHWESQASKVAFDAGIRCVSASSMSGFEECASDNQQYTCVFVDCSDPQVDWLGLHQVMLDNSIDIPVVGVTAEGGLKETDDAVKHADFLLTYPINQDSILGAIDSAFKIQKLVSHRFEVERSYRQLMTLSERERLLITLAVEGMPNKQIAKRLGLNIKSIERIRRGAYVKLGVRCTAEMTRVVTLAELHESVYLDGSSWNAFAISPSSPKLKIVRTWNLSMFRKPSLDQPLNRL